MSHRHALLLVALAFALIPAAAAAGTAPHAPRSVEGVVRDQTSLVLPGVTVVLLPTRAETVTDPDGRFRFDGLEPGHYRITVTLAGVGSGESRSLDLVASRSATVDLVLSAAFAETVVVTGTRTRLTLAEAPVRTEVIPTKAIEQLAPRTLADTLEFTPGVRVDNNCQNCNFSQIRLLGLDGTYTQILIDGQPLVGSLAQVYGVEQIPARLIDRVEVVKGGSSALYGSGSVGGVVNVITREAASSGMTLTADGTSMRGEPGFSLGGVANWTDAGGRTFVTGFVQADGTEAVDLTGDGFTEVGRRRLQAGGGKVIRYWFDGKGRLSVDGQYMHEFRRGGDNLDRPEPEAAIAERADSNGLSASVSWFHAVSPRFDYRVATSVSDTRRDTYYGTGYDPNAFGASSSRVAVVDLQLSHYLHRHVLTWGAQASREHLVDEQPAYGRRIDDTYQSAGVFVQDAWSVGRGWQILTGVRADRPNTLDSAGISPRTAVKWSPRPDITVRTSVATGFRAPQVFDEDLHINSVNGVSYLISNEPGLTRETSVSLLSGFDWRPRVWGGTALVEVNVFATHLANLFAVVEADDPATPEFEFRRVNARGGSVRGVEANLGWGLGTSFVAQIGMVEQRATYDESEPDFGSRDFFRTPRRSVVGLLTWKHRVGDFLVASRFTGSMRVPHYAGYIDSDRLETTRHFVEVDASYARRLTKGRPLVTLRATARNLTNTFQDDIDQGPLRDSGYIYGPRYPRSLGIGLQWEF